MPGVCRPRKIASMGDRLKNKRALVTASAQGITDGSAIGAIVGAEARFDILVNCAGVVHHGSVLECSESDWDQACDLNVKSMFLTIREVLPGMKASGGGSSVNISSICAHRGLPNRFAYGATKAAVIGLTKSVAADFVADNISCNAI